MWETIKKYLHSSYLLKNNINFLSGHFVKNTIFYLVGLTILWVYGLSLETSTVIFAYLGFMFIYSSVYMLNDYFDYEDDNLYYNKKKYKPSIYAGITKEDLMGFGVFSLVVGLIFCSLVNIVYVKINIILLILNLIHAHKVLRLKEHLSISNLNIFIIQLFKFAMPWFIIVDKISFMPWAVIVYFASIYVLVYAMQKSQDFNIDKIETKANIILFVSLAVSALFFSIYSLELFRLGLIVSLLVGIVLFAVLKVAIDSVSNLENTITIYNIGLITFVLSLLLV